MINTLDKVMEYVHSNEEVFNIVLELYVENELQLHMDDESHEPTLFREFVYAHGDAILVLQDLPYFKENEEHNERLLHIQDMYHTWLDHTSGRGISYGEIHFIETLPLNEIDDFEKELVNELDKLNLL